MHYMKTIEEIEMDIKNKPYYQDLQLIIFTELAHLAHWADSV